MLPLVLDRKRHRLVDTPVAKAVRERTGDPEFGTYFHMEHGTCVLFRWVSRTTGVVREYCTFRHPSLVTRQELRDIVEAASYRNVKRLRSEAKRLKGEKRSTLNAEEDMRREHESRFKWAMRKRPNANPYLMKQAIF